MIEEPTLPSLLARHARDIGDRPAVVFCPDGGEELQITYGQLDRAARSVAAWLRKNCARGDAVLIMHPTGIDFVQSLIGCMYAGVAGVPMPLPGRFPHHWDRCASIARDAGAKLVLTDSSHKAEVTEWLHSSSDLVIDLVLLEDLLREDHDDILIAESAEDIAFLQYTSGSTSDPKGVIVTQRNLAYHTRFSSEALGFCAADRFCSWLPIYHDFGLVAMLLIPLAVGGMSIQMTPTHFLKRPIVWFRLIDRFKATITASPTFGFAYAVERVADSDHSNLDLRSLRWAFNGAEPVDAKVMTAFKQRFSKSGLAADAFGPCYGLAEATLGVAFPRAGQEARIVLARREALELGQLEVVAGQDGDQPVVLVGSGFPNGVEVAIVGHHADPLDEAQVGEIWVRGESIASGYWRRSDATSTTFGLTLSDGRQGWLRTGDLGFLLEGEVFVTGRIKEVIIANGRNLYPHDLEREVQKVHPGAHNRPGCVFADDAAALVAIQEFRAPGGVEATERDALLRDMARVLSEVSGLPVKNVLLVQPGSVRRTTSGKIQRHRTREALASGDLVPIASLAAV